MANQEKLEKIVDLTRKISRNYLENINARHINQLKEKLHDFLTNPLWNDDLILELRENFNELRLDENEFRELWRRVEKELESTYSRFLNRKPHIFEGKIKDYENRLINFFIKTGELKGQNETFSTIIGYFLIHKSLTQAQVKELTGFSKGTVSTNLNALEEYGFLKKELIKGTRKYLYSFGESFSQLSMDTGTFKKEINQKAKTFFQSKIKELNNYKNKKGYNLLSERLDGVMKFLEIHKKLIDHIMDSEFMKKIKDGGI